MAADPRSMEAYYERRAPEYDDWYLGRGLFAERDRPGWEDELRAVEQVVASLPPARTLDVACGTGFVTRHLRGRVVATDRSPAMLAESRRRHSHPLVLADAFELPFADGGFDRILAGHFYGHLDPAQRARFLDETRRVSSSLLIMDAAIRDEVRPEEIQERVLNDGSVHPVFKRYFTGSQLADELGGADVLFEGRWFVIVDSRLD